MAVRWLELDGAANVRDVGGIPTSDGGTTVAGRLLRADNLQTLSEGDVARLVDTVGLSTVVDLRTSAEIVAEGPGPLTRVADVEHLHCSLIPEWHWNDGSPDALAIRRRADEARYDGDRRAAHYLGYVEHRAEGIVDALRAIADAPGAALVHCAAGKDRTGVVVAFALSVAGARREEIVRDYAATAERITAIVERLSTSPTYAEDVLRVPLDHHTPRPETMAEFLDQLDVRYGGIEAWLGRNGFGDSDVERLRIKLLAR